jgi:hypothetical protein
VACSVLFLKFYQLLILTLDSCFADFTSRFLPVLNI